MPPFPRKLAPIDISNLEDSDRMGPAGENNFPSGKVHNLKSRYQKQNECRIPSGLESSACCQAV